MSYCALYDVLVNKKFPLGPLACFNCNSLGCIHSVSYVPVSKWRCYQHKFENK